MADTTSNGIIIPAGSDRISATGVAEMRTIGTTTDAALDTRATTIQMAAANDWIETLRLYIQENGGIHGAGIVDIIQDTPGQITIVWMDPDTAGTTTEVIDLPAGFGNFTEVSPGLWELQAEASSIPIGQVTGLAAELSAAQAHLAALTFDTGWRIITPDAGVTGTIKVRRKADRTILRFEGVLPPTGVGSAYLVSLPVGFRHTEEHWFIADGRSGELPSVIGLYNGSRAAWVTNVAGGNTRPIDPIFGEYSWESPDIRPDAPYPGTAG